MANCLTLKKSNCKSCFRCVRKCPVKAIRFSGSQAHIIGNECILCGNCVVQCPQNAKEITDSTETVRVLLQAGAPVVASLAPSFVAAFEGIGFEGMRQALKALGFADAEETALGATMVKTEYERMLREDDRDVLISSCCHSINLLIQKYYPACLQYLADVVSPMQAHCQDIKQRMPDAKTVFIGPCVAKKDEAEYYEGIVDAVLTFEELRKMLAESNITLTPCEDTEDGGRARIFPTAGGILKTMAQDAPGYTYIAIDGVENCMAALEDIQNGKVHKCFIEMSACVGSCIGGPVMDKSSKSPMHDLLTVVGFATEEDFAVDQPAPLALKKGFSAIVHKLPQPSEAEIMAVMRQMGKFRPSDELNCGSCGYNSCREKAIAICQGKAEITMCLPFLKDKAESFSEAIVRNTPNGLIVLNENLEIQQINAAARRIVNIRSASDVMGEPVIRILDPTPFMLAKNGGLPAREQRVYLAEYGKYIDQTIIYDKDSHMLICIMRDVSEQVAEREKKESISLQTIEVADRVVEKQMRIVQEIASLLGETAAETKIALTKLKESISDE